MLLLEASAEISHHHLIRNRRIMKLRLANCLPPSQTRFETPDRCLRSVLPVDRHINELA